MKKVPKRYLSADEACWYLGRPKGWIYKQSKKGEPYNGIAHFRIAGRVFFSVEDLDTYMSQYRIASDSFEKLKVVEEVRSEGRQPRDRYRRRAAV